MGQYSDIFHRLEISNIEKVLMQFGSRRTGFYSGPFEIIGILEKMISTNPVAEDVVTVPYKDGGDAIFHLKEIKTRDGQIPISVYEFNTTAS